LSKGVPGSSYVPLHPYDSKIPSLTVRATKEPDTKQLQHRRNDRPVQSAFVVPGIVV